GLSPSKLSTKDVPLYPATAPSSLLLLLLLDQLHGGGRGRGSPHGPHHFDALLKAPQCELGKRNTLWAMARKMSNMELKHKPSSFLKDSWAIFHSGLSSSV
uniref:Uncharacterized protein n=1 Tax=Neogobius melanostomus TaxID=47308 RepID=A0A8C6UUG3_9GOBI